MMKVIKISTSTCGPCKMLKPTWSKIKDEFQSREISFKEVELDTCAADDARYVQSLKVTSVPTIVITDNEGNEMERLQGFKTFNDLKMSICKCLAQDNFENMLKTEDISSDVFDKK